MKMYCKKCNKTTKVKKTKTKSSYAIWEEYKCKECGYIIWIISENRRNILWWGKDV